MIFLFMLVRISFLSALLNLGGRFSSSQMYRSMAVSAAGEADSSGMIDSDFPGTAVQRMLNIRDRVKNLKPEQLSGDWMEVRRMILWAGGLRDLPDALPGQGYTGHSFNDFNHCDLTAMAGDVAHNENEGKVAGIHYSNKLGRGIEVSHVGQEYCKRIYSISCSFIYW